MRREIERVVEGIRERYHEDLSLENFAEMARLSPYHLTRVFRRETGLPPHRFLGAVRLEEAKRMLVFTDHSVVDISVQVGYSSLGTFTTRFTDMVGISPGRYRRLQRLQAHDLTCPAPTAPAPFTYGAISGWTHRPSAHLLAPVFIAAFPAEATSHHPERGRLESGPGPWRLNHIPEGKWIVRAVSMADCCDLTGFAPEDAIPVLVGQAGPVQVRAGESIHVDLVLRPPMPMRDPDVGCHTLA